MRSQCRVVYGQFVILKSFTKTETCRKLIKTYMYNVQEHSEFKQQYLVFQKIQLWEIARVIKLSWRIIIRENSPTGFWKSRMCNYFVWQILMSKGYCRAFVVFSCQLIVSSDFIYKQYSTSLPLQKFPFYGINVREIEIKYAVCLVTRL